MLRVRDNELINCCEDIVLIFDDIVHVEYMQILWNIYIWERKKFFGFWFNFLKWLIHLWWLSNI